MQIIKFQDRVQNREQNREEIIQKLNQIIPKSSYQITKSNYSITKSNQSSKSNQTKTEMQKQQSQRMQQQILSGQNYDDNEQDFQILAENSSSPEEIFFDQVVAALQEIIVDDKFEKIQTSFMKHHCHQFQDTEENKMSYMKIFQDYQNQIEKHIEKSLYEMVPGFQMETFLTLLQTRTEQIDQQILEILHSFSDFQTFKRLILDYKSYYQQEQRLKALTIKSSKIPENKKVKGSNNIFSVQGFNLGGNNPLAPLKKNDKPHQKKDVNQKNQDELLIPDLVLTVRPLRKA